MNEPTPNEVIVVGAGPAGLAFAVALAQAEIGCLVVEQNSAGSLVHPEEDGRDIALTHRSRRILETLGIWQRLPQDEIAPLRQAQVSNGGSPLVLPFDGRADGHEQLGWLVPNHRIREAAFAAAQAAPLVRIQGDTRIAGFEREARAVTLRAEGGATLSAEGGATMRAALVVAADSRFSSVRRMAGIGARSLDFGRTAIVCRLTHEGDHEGIARECFRYGNTLALLPMAGRQSSAVVTLGSDHVADWMAASDAEFARRIQAQLGGSLGSMAVAGARHAYPLVGVYASRFAGPRFALVGDAAVGMHPVTAHGYNFGLYGIEVLAGELARMRQLGRDLGENAPLLAYEREHRRATLPIYVGTNAIVQLFTDERSPAKLLRGAVLQAAKRLPPLQSLIARQLTGAPRAR